MKYSKRRISKLIITFGSLTTCSIPFTAISCNDSKEANPNSNSNNGRELSWAERAELNQADGIRTYVNGLIRSGLSRTDAILYWYQSGIRADALSGGHQINWNNFYGNGVTQRALDAYNALPR